MRPAPDKADHPAEHRQFRTGDPFSAACGGFRAFQIGVDGNRRDHGMGQHRDPKRSPSKLPVSAGRSALAICRARTRLRSNPGTSVEPQWQTNDREMWRLAMDVTLRKID
jgi:hypothetical protein